MKKQILLKPLLTLALVMICRSAWGEDKVLTFDVSKNPGGWPTENSTTLTNYTYKLNDVNYSFGLKNVKCNSGYLMLTATAALGLPAIEGYKLTKVVAKNSGGCSISTNVGISTISGSKVSYLSGGETQIWGTKGSSYTYDLSETANNTVYYLYVTSANAQIVSLELTYDDGKTPAKELVSIAISSEPSKTDYYEGEEFDPSGLVVTGTYDDDSQKEITSGITWTFNPETLSIGTTSVDVVATVDDVSSDPYTVNEIEVSERPIVSAFYESFDANKGTGGNDEKWDGDIAKSDISYNNDGWTFASGTGAYQCAKIGISSKMGNAETPAINFGIGSTACLTFKAAAWKGDATSIYVLATNGTISQSSVTLKDSEWEEYSIFIRNITGPLKIKFEAKQASKNRFFLDEVKIEQVFDASISSSAKYATLCLPFNFTIPEGVTAYTAKVDYEKNFVNINAISVGAVIPANTGIIIYSDVDKPATYTFTGSAATPSSLGDNDLVGVTEDTELEEGDYILALDGGVVKFCPIDLSDKVLAANKAYLKLSSSSPALGIRVNDATGIRAIEAQAVNQYLDLMGRKVQNPERGIYILNGKKVYVK